MKRILPVAIVWLITAASAFPQVDIENRRSVTAQTGFPLVRGEEAVGGVAYFWYNRNHFPWTNSVLRVIFSGIYLDAELSYFVPGSPGTAVGIGGGGGVFIDNIIPYRNGQRLSDQEFYGDGANLRLFVDQTIPNRSALPLNIRATYIASRSFYRETDNTSNFTLPPDFWTHTALLELRWGGVEPGLIGGRGLEFYVSGDSNYRTGFRAFGPNGSFFERHDTYKRAFSSLTAQIPVGSCQLNTRIGGGLGDGIDELSAWKLGGNLLKADAYSYTLHGYYTREIFAEDFAIANLGFDFPIAPKWHRLMGHLYGDYALANTVPPNDGRWHNFFGTGAGISFRTFWDINVLLSYGYGFNAVRSGEHGGHEMGIALEKKF